MIKMELLFSKISKVGKNLVFGFLVWVAIFTSFYFNSLVANAMEINGVVYNSGLSFDLLTPFYLSKGNFDVWAILSELIGMNEDSIWVNLSPSIDSTMVFPPDLYGTRVGQILLKMDLQLKKDLINLLGVKAPEVLERIDEGEIPLIRVWVVPGKVSVAIEGNRLYIIKADLEVNIENMESYNAYLSDYLIAQLREKVNKSAVYKPLRMLFQSVIIARFIKEKLSDAVSERLLRWIGSYPVLFSRNFYFLDYLRSLCVPEQFSTSMGVKMLVGGINLSFSWEKKKGDDLEKEILSATGMHNLLNNFIAKEIRENFYSYKEPDKLLNQLRESVKQFKKQGQLFALSDLLKFVKDNRIKEFLEDKYSGLSVEKQELFRLFASLSILRKEWQDISELPFSVRLVLEDGTIFRDFPVIATRSNLEFLCGLDLIEVVNLLNFYILGEKENFETVNRWRKEFDKIYTGSEPLWKQRLLYGFMPLDKIGGQIMGLEKDIAKKVPQELFAVLKDIWSEDFINNSWPLFLRVYNDLKAQKVRGDTWMNLIVLSSLANASADRIEQALIKQQLSKQIDKLMKERDSAMKSGDEETFSRLQAIFVDVLRMVGLKYPDLIREKLSYKFKDELSDKDWQSYYQEYKQVLGEEKAEAIFSAYEKLAKRLLSKGKTRIVLFNATFFGGGVAEMIPGLYKFFKKYGITLDWYIVEPRNPAKFYGVTKKVHNICQGDRQAFDEKDEKILREVGKDNFQIYRNIINAPDVGAVFFEDPQVLTLLEYALEDNPAKDVDYIFRLHIDITGLEQAKPGTGAYNVKRFMNKILSELHSRGGILLFQPYQVPAEWRGKKRVYEQPPGIDINNEKNKYREIGSTEQPGTVKFFLKEASKKIVDTGGDIKSLVDLWRRPVWLTGARADGWKGILQAIEAYSEFRDKLGFQIGDSVPKLVVCAGGANDDPEVGQIKEQIISLIKNSPYRKDIVFVWNPQGPEMVSLYRLAKEGGLAYIALSVREGYNLMVEEAARQGALIITTNAGGLYRFIDRENGSPYHWIVDVTDRVLSNATLESLTAMNDSKTALSSQVSRELVSRLAKKMVEFWQTYHSNPESYQADAKELYRRTLESSLVVMGQHYLDYAVRVVDGGVRGLRRLNDRKAGFDSLNKADREIGEDDYKRLIEEIARVDTEALRSLWENGLFVVLAHRAGLLSMDAQELAGLWEEISRVIKIFYPQNPDLFDSAWETETHGGISADVTEIIDLLREGNLTALKSQLGHLFGLKQNFDNLNLLEKGYNLETKVAMLVVLLDSIKTQVINSDKSRQEDFLPILGGLVSFVRANVSNIDWKTVLGLYGKIKSGGKEEAGGIEIGY